MRRRSIESLYSRDRGGATGVLGALQVPSRGWRGDTIWRTTGQLLPDLVSSGARVVRKTRLPSRGGVLAFFGNQLGANAVAWTAGVMAAGLVEALFEQRSMRNLWGLAAWGGRTLVSADDYRVIMSLTSYTTGLVMLILIRHLVLRWASEFRDLRLESGERDQASDPS
jgi:hypothetical protein